MATNTRLIKFVATVVFKDGKRKKFERNTTDMSWTNTEQAFFKRARQFGQPHSLVDMSAAWANP